MVRPYPPRCTTHQPHSGREAPSRPGRPPWALPSSPCSRAAGRPAARPPPSLAGWTTLRPVTAKAGSRLDSLHQLAAAGDTLHLVHPRTGDASVTTAWSTSAPRTAAGLVVRADLFSATRRLRDVVPNLALDAQGRMVIVAWRVRGSAEHALRPDQHDGGLRFAEPESASRQHRDGLGVPAVAVGGGFVAVAWTDRASGRVKVTQHERRPDLRRRPSPRPDAASPSSAGPRSRTGSSASPPSRRLHVAWSKAPGRLPRRQHRHPQVRRPRPHLVDTHRHQAPQLRLAGAGCPRPHGPRCSPAAGRRPAVPLRRRGACWSGESWWRRWPRPGSR